MSTGFGRKLEFLFRPPVALSAFRPEMYSADRMRCLLENIGREISLKRSDYLDMVHINLYEILILLKRAGALDTGELKDWASRYRIWDMEDIVLYINDNFDESLTLDDLASRCALNSSYFSRRFKERTGIPLFEYINHLRIDRSCGLLRNSSLTILEIAMSVGYNNVSFFNRYFKRLKGISPGEYRRRMK